MREEGNEKEKEISSLKKMISNLVSDYSRGQAYVHGVIFMSVLFHLDIIFSCTVLTPIYF